MVEEVPRETLLEKMADKIKGHDSSSSSSSSDSDNDEKKVFKKSDEKIEPAQEKIYRIFGREKPVHTLLGGGQPADIVLWRNKKVSAGVFGVVTAIWVTFVLLEYFLLTFLCHCLIISLSILFLWSNVSSFINKSSSPHIPNIHIPEDVVVNTALCLRNDINRALCVLRDISSGKDLKKFLGVIAGLWILSIIGSSCNFLTLFYIIFVLLHTVPLLYEKYDDKVDAFAEKAVIEVKKQYVLLDAKVLCKIPVGPWKDKKH